MANPRNLLIAATAIPAFALATPAAADVLPAASAAFAKSEAILGAPSALAQILAEQGAPPRLAPLQPAGYGLQRATFRRAIASRTARDMVSPGVLSGRPDVFGTVALKVGHTPLDDRWQRVEHAGVGGSAAAYASSLRDLDETARVDAVNRYVNGRVHFVDDSRQFGRADVWSTANSTLHRGRGDCEDYAIAKIQMLRAAGFSDRDLYLVVLKDLVRRADHAVAVVRTGRHMNVLDNGTDRVLDSDSVSDYRPVLTFAASGTWTHGYRVAKTPITVASADLTMAAPVASGAAR
jgi:predicted transglutaminase-like cysteine proteinase